MNPELDGYNGEQDGNSLEGGVGPREEWRCPACGKVEGELIACFGYQYEVEDDDETIARLQDYFDTFILIHRCANAKQHIKITALEWA